MRTLALLAIAASVAGCGQIPKNANDLKNLPPEKLAKADFIAPVPVASAYRNVLLKARECWQGDHVVLEVDPYDPAIGYARIGVRMPGDAIIPMVMQTVVDFYPMPDTTTKVTGVSYASPSIIGSADIPSLQQWAEGKDVPCG